MARKRKEDSTHKEWERYLKRSREYYARNREAILAQRLKRYAERFAEEQEGKNE